MTSQVILTAIETNNPVLMTCTPESREQLFARGTIRRVATEEVLFEEGAPAGVVLLPLTGTYQFSKSAERKRRQILCSLSCKSCNGICLLTMAERSLADVMALTAGEILLVPRKDFQLLARGDPTLCQAGWQAAVECLSHFSDLVEHLSFRKVSERVSLALLEGSQRDGDLVRLTQAELAAEVGTTREVVARCLASLQAAGAVRLGRARITVISRRKLEQEAS